MPVENVTRKVGHTKKSDKLRPTVITWKGHHMVRAHSFLASIREVIRFSEELDVVRIGLIGDMHSGKSTLSQAIAHAIHKYAKLPYSVKILYKDDLLNFAETLKSLESKNYILIFDDVSFLGSSANKQQIEMVKSAITTIRHLEGGQDVKIIVMMNYHYSFGLDKYLRTADFKYITTIGSSEGENMEKMFGVKNRNLIVNFKKWRQQAIASEDKLWKMKISNNKGDPAFAYKFRAPFIPVLFWNESSLRFVVTPQRQFMDEICSTCTGAEEPDRQSDIPIPQFMDESERKFGGKTNWISAVRLALFMDGKTVFRPNVTRAFRYLNKCRMEKIINLEECATYYDLTETKTRAPDPSKDVIE